VEVRSRLPCRRNTPRYRITPSIDVLPILSFGLHVMSVPSVHPSGRTIGMSRVDPHSSGASLCT